jgi:hypothetical protein
MVCTLHCVASDGLLFSVAEIAPALDHLLRRAAADSQLEAPIRDEIRSAGVLCHVMRVLIPHVDDGGANFDFSCLSADRREQREWGCQLLREVMNAEVIPIYSGAKTSIGQRTHS